MYASRASKKIRNESPIYPKIEECKKKIQDTDDPDELIKLSAKLNKLAKFKKIEAGSTPGNTINLTYEVIFGTKQYDRKSADFEELLKLKFAIALSNAHVGFTMNEIQLIIFKTRCKAVIHGIKELTGEIQQNIARLVGNY